MSETTGLEVKQVIVMRNDLNMRKGKMIAQGAHASLSFLSDKLGFRKNKFNENLEFDDEEKKWFTDAFTKITLQVNSEEELHEICKNATEKGLRTHLILDAGRTEFNGIPTYTCLAIGPNYAHKIDEITKHLKLL